MTTSAPRILIVDDDADFVELYRDVLGRAGYAVEVAQREDEARQRFVEGEWGVIVLDQKLRGPGGPDVGIDLLTAARRLAPAAKVIIATAFAEPASIAQAFALGAYDYLQKDRLFEHFLKAKVRNALEAWQERAMAALSVERREQEIQDLWRDARAEPNAQRKGELLEQLLLRIVRAVPGFEHAQVNRENELEEIDVLVQNRSSDPFWQREGGYVLVECKHWSKPVGAPELKAFRDKIEDRYGRASLGFFVALGGYASTTRLEELTRRGGRSLVVLLSAADLQRLVQGRDRDALLKEFHARSVMARGSG